MHMHTGDSALSRTAATALIAALPTSTNRRLLFVGEPGIGKTTLLAAAAENFAATGSLVLRASPKFAERNTSYSVLWELLHNLDHSALDSIAGEHHTIIEIALALGPPLTELPVLTSALSFEHMLRVLSAHSTVVLLIDDLHWCDPESTAVIERALRHLTDKRVHLVATSHAYGTPADDTAGLTFDPSQVHYLDGMTIDELETLARPAWPSTPTRSQVIALREHTGGNPMWALELIRRRAIGELGALRIGTLDAPRPLAVSVTSQLQGLSRQASEVVSIVALLGRPTLELLREVLRFSNTPEGAIEEAENAGFLEVTTTTATTRHPLFASAATASLDPSRRRQLHAFIAQAVTDPVIRAQHLQQSKPSGSDETIAAALTEAAVFLRQQGERLRSAHFDAQAVERTDSLTGAFQTRLLAQAQHLFSAGDYSACFRALGRVSSPSLNIPQYDTWVALMTSANPVYARDFLKSTRSTDGTRKAINAANSASAASLSVSQRGLLSETSLTDLVDADTPNATHRALRGVARSRLDSGGGLDQSIISDMNRRQAIQIVVGLDDSGLATQGFLAHLADDVDTSRRSFATLIDWARAEGKEGVERTFLAQAALVELVAGDVVTARQFGERSAFDITASDLPTDVQPMAGMLLIAAGRHTDLRQAVALWRASSGETDLECEGLLGMSALARRDWHEAIDHLRVAAQIADNRELVELGSRFRVDLPLVEALLQVGDTNEATMRLDRIRSLLQTRDRPISQIGLHRMTSLQLAASGNLSAALSESTAAVTLSELCHRQGDRMLALLQRARILRRLRRVAQARDDLQVAQELFDQAGMEGLRHHHDAAFTQKRSVVSPTELTAAERRVEALARAGQSNREIAASLFVSVRTVESHISAILRKTGSASRSKLIARE